MNNKAIRFCIKSVVDYEYVENAKISFEETIMLKHSR